MKTIYLNESDFFDFLQNRYLIIAKKHENKTKTKTIWIKYHSLFNTNKSNILFISQIDTVSTPNDAFFPQIMVLYGLPKGLLIHRNEPMKQTKAKLVANKETKEDKFYLMLRRALLFSQVWSVKNINIEDAKSFINNFIDKKSLTPKLLLKIVEEMVGFNDFPEDKPLKVNIDDTKFKYQMIWLGRFLKSIIFDNIQMDEKSREWFLNCYHANPKKVTAKLKPYQSLIIGYVIALKANNKGKHEFAFLIEKLQESAYYQHPLQKEIVNYALFFVGLFFKKADNYYMSEVASKLFFEIEKCVFVMSKKRTLENINIDEAYKNISDAFLDPVKNCVNYYRLKNPNLVHKSYYEYPKNEGDYVEMTPVLRPNLVVPFLNEQNKIISFDNLLEKGVFITQNELFFKRFKVLFDNVLYLNNERKIEGTFRGFSFNDEIISDSQLLIRWLRKIGFKKLVDLQSHLHIDKFEWVVLTSNSQIDAQNQTLLQLLSKTIKPTKLYLFNFIEPQNEPDVDLFSSEDYFSKNRNRENWGVMKNNKEQEKNQAMLQSQVLSMFSNANVSVVSTDVYNEPWEMINLGIGLLRKTSLDNCVLIDARTNKMYARAFEVVARCFSDIIIYDENQKYLFLNL